MVNLQTIPASHFKSFGFQTKKQALTYLRSLGFKNGKEFLTLNSLNFMLNTWKLTLAMKDLDTVSENLKKNKSTFYVKIECFVKKVFQDDSESIVSTPDMYVKEFYTSQIQIKEEVQDFVNRTYPYVESAYYVYCIRYTYTIISEREFKSSLPNGNIQDMFLFDVIHHCSYYNVEDNKTFNRTENECVYDVLEGRYNIEREIALEIFQEFVDQDLSTQNIIHRKLDFHHGVTTKMIHYLCQKKDIGMYAFDIESHLILTNKRRSHNNPVLCFYVMNSHMYLITDQKRIQSLIKTSAETTIVSSVFTNIDDVNQGEKKFLENSPIYENIGVPENFIIDGMISDSIMLWSKFYEEVFDMEYFLSLNKSEKERYTNEKLESMMYNFEMNEFLNCKNEKQIKKYIERRVCVPEYFVYLKSEFNIEALKQLENCNIIYSTSDLKQIFLSLYYEYNFIFKYKNDGLKITHITLNHGPFKSKNIDLYIDNNLSNHISWKETKAICEKLKIPYTNQGMGKIANDIFHKLYQTKNARVRISKAMKKSILEKQNDKCNECELEIKKCFHIDHITPLASGGDNSMTNLQALCIDCHAKKTASEHENGDFVMIDEHKSSYNKTTREIFDSNLFKRWAFIDVLKGEDKEMKKCLIDMNKTRKNILYYSKYKFPVYSVMDEPEEYKNDKIKCGFYFVESKNTFPLRGNGWYSQPMVLYCLENNIIKRENIKYQLVPKMKPLENTYFKRVIDHVYTSLDAKYAKIIINSLIGSFNIYETTHMKTLMTSKLQDVCYMHFKSQFKPTIFEQVSEQKRLYMNYKEVNTCFDESCEPLYNMIIDIEALEMHRLSSLIKSNDGIVLERNTDGILFNIDEVFSIDDYYWDDEKTVQKYKYEKNAKHIPCGRMTNIKRREKYIYKKENYNITNDPMHDNFDDVAKKIVESGKGVNIDGIAGAGKSFMVKAIQKILLEKEIPFLSLAPTNKAALLIGGMTIHSFILKYKMMIGKNEFPFKYIFIDEISMMKEMFYKVMITMKRKCGVKFIMSGDFRQLPPVKDRFDFDYKNSMALYELSDGNRLILSKCRRSDKELYEMSMNLDAINPKNFNDKIGLVNLCYTNKKRKEINELCMRGFIQCHKLENLLEIKEVPSIPDSQRIRLGVGMPVICRKNSKEYGLANNSQYIVKSFDKTNITIHDNDNEVVIPKKVFSFLFNIGFCITVHKSQGATFDKPYCIFEWEKFDHALKYVAITRATKKELINFF